jgi:hypothetical protein
VSGRVFAEEALQAAGGAAWWHPAFAGRDRDTPVSVIWTRPMASVTQAQATALMRSASPAAR